MDMKREGECMDNKKMRLIWSIALLIIGILAMINGVSRIIGFKQPKVMLVIIIALNLIALAVLAFTTVKLYLKKSEKQENEE